MKRPKVIIFDLDGTLLPSSKVITPFTLDVLQQLKAEGMVVGLATGKFFHLTEDYGNTLGPDVPIIALDGARIRLTGANGAVEEKGIGEELTVTLLDKYGDRAEHLFIDSGQDELLLQGTDERINEAVRPWASKRRWVDDVRAHIDGNPGILNFYGAMEEMVDLAEVAGDTYEALRVNVFQSLILNCGVASFQPRTTTKGTGVQSFLDFKGVAPEDCMVFGDWANDIPMFESGFVNVAMENAMDPLKNLAHHITEDDCENDGVARFLQKHFL